MGKGAFVVPQRLITFFFIRKLNSVLPNFKFKIVPMVWRKRKNSEREKKEKILNSLCDFC